jgi:hypothetical protein
MDLFDEKYETYTDAARELDMAATRALKPLAQKYVELGCRTQEIENILVSAAGTLMCEMRLELQVKRRKKGR